MKLFIEELINWIVTNKYEIIVGVILIPAVIWIFCYFFSSLFLHFKPLKLSPYSKKILCDNNSIYRKENYYVYLTNNDKKPLYDVNLWADFPKDVEVSMSPEKQSESTMLGDGLVIDSASFQVFGASPDGQLGFTQTIINSLAPSETIKIKVSIDKKNYKKDFNLKIKSKFNSRTPKPSFSA